jgi:hypothetical protein
MGYLSTFCLVIAGASVLWTPTARAVGVPPCVNCGGNQTQDGYRCEGMIDNCSFIWHSYTSKNTYTYRTCENGIKIVSCPGPVPDGCCWTEDLELCPTGSCA